MSAMWHVLRSDVRVIKTKFSDTACFCKQNNNYLRSSILLSVHNKGQAGSFCRSDNCYVWIKKILLKLADLEVWHVKFFDKAYWYWVWTVTVTFNNWSKCHRKQQHRTNGTRWNVLKGSTNRKYKNVPIQNTLSVFLENLFYFTRTEYSDEEHPSNK